MGDLMVRVLSTNNTYEDREMDDSELVDLILQGASLRTFMIPDSSIPSNYPEHAETYDLPHVIINGKYFWGKSETTHLGYIIGNQEWSLGAFCYTNIEPVFCSYDPDLHAARL